MKKLIWLSLALAPLMGRAQDYHLTVKLRGLKAPAEAYLIYEYAMSDQRVLDSAAADNGTVTFKGTAGDPPVKVSLVINHNGAGWQNLGRMADTRVLYLERGNMLLQGDDSAKSASLTGSALNAVYEKYYAMVLAPADKLVDADNAAYRMASDDRKKSKEFVDSMMTGVKGAMKERDSLKYIYIAQNHDSYLSLVALEEVAGQNIDVSKIDPLFKDLSDSIRDSQAGKDFAAAIDRARFTSIGSMAPDFTQNDSSGHPVKLSDFRGKYVLLDFWASWCGPCRAENPNVLKAYNAYKDKNFTVLSVSLDGPGKKAAWLAAVKADGLPWTQVSDLKYWNNEAAKLYSIKAIPQNFLIDPTGKIVGRNLRGDALEKKLSTLL